MMKPILLIIVLSAVLIVSATTAGDTLDHYQAQLEAYLSGKRDYAALSDLALAAQKHRDGEMALRIAADYKAGYLDHLDKASLMTRENLYFVCRFFDIIRSDDKFFDIFLHHGSEANELLKGKEFVPDVAGVAVRYVVRKEELENRLWKSGKPLAPHPDWDAISQEIRRKYGQGLVDAIVPEYRIGFYGRIGNWAEYVRLNDELNTKNGLKPGGGLSSDSWRLNSCAWEIFLHSDDRALLETALGWSEKSIDLAPGRSVQYWDTKANLLYKLGRKEEAIASERQAIQEGIEQARARGSAKGYFYDEYQETIAKMQAGEPTWPVKETRKQP